ncbi:hypothetical protein HDV00_012234 [Rhizophlyctis rosea]|nr:hypothetical protein HDV00_012234 [Rhizophlyctis rosea]
MPLLQRFKTAEAEVTSSRRKVDEHMQEYQHLKASSHLFDQTPTTTIKMGSQASHIDFEHSSSEQSIDTLSPTDMIFDPAFDFTTAPRTSPTSSPQQPPSPEQQPSTQTFLIPSEPTPTISLPTHTRITALQVPFTRAPSTSSTTPSTPSQTAQSRTLSDTTLTALSSDPEQQDEKYLEAMLAAALLGNYPPSYSEVNELDSVGAVVADARRGRRALMKVRMVVRSVLS